MTDEDDVIYRGRLVTLLTRRAPGPDGAEQRYEVVEHPPAVAIVAVMRPDGQRPAVALVRQPRPAVGQETWELPAGLARVASGETPEAAARRELREEAGAESGTWTELGQVYTSPGFTDERITLFLADNVTIIPGAAPDPHEISSLTWEPLDWAIQQVESGAQGDAKTALGLLLARDQFARKGVAVFTPDVPGTGSPFTPPERVEARGGGSSSGLNLENMLLQEYNYASSTAYQALEDRARIFSFYLGLVGALMTAIGVIAQIGGGLQSKSSREVIIAVLAVIGASGVAFFLQLIRLRQAWRQSALAMNIIKEHYIDAFKEDPRAAQMFHWRLRTLPKGEKYNSMSFVICMTVALLDSLGFAAAALLALLIWLAPQLGDSITGGAVSWGIALLVLLVVLLAHLVYFSRTLSAKKEDEATAKAAAAAGLPPEVLK